MRIILIALVTIGLATEILASLMGIINNFIWERIYALERKLKRKRK